ncbi:MAG: sigma-70 family RNA polymerase sigma factor [Myxococcaceae bacterium]|nr:MAG: sigma-70 family RNA polymerase sigma factor [Myxococcaceae bacterium]
MALMRHPSSPQASPAPSDGARMSDELARHYLIRVGAHVRRLARRLPPHIACNDLISAGLLGVVEGFRRFDPERAESLDAYLDHRIRGALLDELRRADPLTRAQRNFARQLNLAAREVSSEPGGACDESLARSLGLELAEFRSRVARVASAAPVQGAGGDELIGDGASAPDDEASRKEERTRLASAIDGLPPREREMLRLYYEEGRTFREIGDQLSVSESRVSQLHSHIVKSLRSTLSG